VPIIESYVWHCSHSIPARSNDNQVYKQQAWSLVDIAQDFSTNVLPARLLVIQDTRGSGQNDDAETTGWEEQVDPGLDLRYLDAEAWRNDASFVKTAVQLDDNLACSVIIDLFELANVTVSLHDAQEFDNDF